MRRGALIPALVIACGIFVAAPAAAPATSGAIATAQAAGPDPMSDADGDGLPYKWETPSVSAPSNPAPTPQKRKKKKCRKGQRRKHGRCVRKKKPKKPGRRHGGKARASLAEPANLAAFGADPDHKDIFVEVDYANEALRQNMSCGQLEAIVAAFADAPVSNPDGRSGVSLHIDAGVSCPGGNFDLGGSRIFNAGACPNTSQIMNATELPESRIGAFHIAGFAPAGCSSGGENGAATLLGTKMAIFTDGAIFAHVLMHELGHNLGLDHQNGSQPNRFSSMNTVLNTSNDGNTATETIDFQRFSVPALDENNLSEEAGISAPAEAHRFFVMHYCEGSHTYTYAWPGDGAIDWNCNTPPFGVPVIDSGTVSADVNGDGQLTVLPATSNEWVQLQYSSGGGIGPR